MTEVKIEPRRPFRPSVVWTVPVIAILLGAWLLIDNYLSQGPTVQVTFKSAEGITSGETLVKRLSVDLGTVEDVYLNEGYSDVTVVIQLDEGTEDLLRQGTQFWVVRPRIGAGGISGLSTILSGGSIELAPGSGALGVRQFTGLESEPITPLSTPGLRVKLIADQANSLNSGSSVLYNGYKVGRVEDTQLSIDDGQAHYTLFIDAPYHDLVTTNTKFWNSSGVSFEAGVDGFALRSASIESLISGGVSFGLPQGLNPGEHFESESEFTLYASYSAIDEINYEYSSQYLVFFDSTVRGLTVGAPVEYRGLRIGSVTQMDFELVLANQALSEQRHGLMPVLIRLDPGRTALDTAARLQDLEAIISEGVANGLRATLSSGNLITGSLFVSLDYYDNAEPAEMTVVSGLTVLPTVNTGLAEIQRQVSSVLDSIQDLSIEETLGTATNAFAALVSTSATVKQTFAQASELLDDPSTRNLPENLNTVLDQLTLALAGISPGSSVYSELDAALSELRETLKNARELTATLEAQPSSLLYPESSKPDLVPEVAPQ